MAEIRGFDGVFYVGAAGAAATTEVDSVINVTPNLTNTEHDVTTRAGNGFKHTALGLTDLSVDAEMMADEDDTNYVMMRTAAQTRGKLAIKVLRDEGGSGHGGDVVVSSMSEPQEIDGYMRATFTMKPTKSTDNAYDWIAATP